jgi:hypothetical protein
VNVEMTEDRLRELMRACNPAEDEVVSVSCGYSSTDGGLLYLLFVPQPELSDDVFRAGLFTRKMGRFSSVRRSPQMHVSADDIEWFLPLVQSFLRTRSGENPQEEVG